LKEDGLRRFCTAHPAFDLRTPVDLCFWIYMGSTCHIWAHLSCTTSFYSAPLYTDCVSYSWHPSICYIHHTPYFWAGQSFT